MRLYRTIRGLARGEGDELVLLDLPYPDLGSLLAADVTLAHTAPVTGRAPLGSIELLPPVSRPNTVVLVGANYRDHVVEAGISMPTSPAYFPVPAGIDVLTGHGSPIVLPAEAADHVDYEAELAVIIGRRATRVSVDDALDHVFGYTGANDVSARDLQFGDGQWTRGKGLDGFLPLGPTVVDAADVADPQDVTIRCRVNGELVQDASTREMVFSVAEIIAFTSEGITLEPGDVLLTGTPKGVGYFRRPQLFLAPGDRVEVEVGDFGVLASPVGDPYPRVAAIARTPQLAKQGR
jgi:2-keto-4-pentenoate hydratase/2-oxohepta-3-ene-1,7-dioic acid hydratase in catechol pathway